MKHDSPIKISLTQFVNFATKPPEQQLTVVRTIIKQHQAGYSVPPDCYKQLRDAIKRMHQEERNKQYLSEFALRQTEPTRAKHYPILAKGYKKFLGRKKIRWFDPPTGNWIYSGLRISLRPELGLTINDAPHVIKLWLNDDASLSKRRAEIINHLMAIAFSSGQNALTFAVLDVRNGKLFSSGKSDNEQTVLLRAQVISFVSMYQNL